MRCYRYTAQRVVRAVKMPEQKPGRSEQTVQTPMDFLTAVEKRFGLLTFDLAATSGNRVAPDYFGPGSSLAEDSLAVDWPRSDLLWLNPPFAHIGTWARKCSMESLLGCDILFLVPLSSSNWACDYVFPYARTYLLNPRLQFIGHATPYPKDMMLCHYFKGAGGFEPWRWKQ